ncbi:uncharacterized protein cubi_01528 [Cryptosporidium ubiquitum]|uniref:Uncharacterized protein n=1 Tax=Cryptosporidium ubiquitum TaxID=857276 RepID=A0A1J4MFF6_9CRYT|nr:uncharacterized protein cubi_01528 [Cryptosporidium ubiquitum]OII72195.1 hypothetical protein cubi_01528 [Cryptosporidium ubiquitum]
MKVLQVLFLLTLYALNSIILRFAPNYNSLYPFMEDVSDSISLLKVSLSNNINRKPRFKLKKRNTMINQSESSKAILCEFQRLNEIDSSCIVKNSEYAVVSCNSIRVLLETMKISIETFQNYYGDLQTSVINPKCLIFLESIGRECLKTENVKFKKCKMINLHLRKVGSAVSNYYAYLEKLDEFLKGALQLFHSLQKYYANCNEYIVFRAKHFEDRVDFVSLHSERMSKLHGFINYVQRINKVYCDPQALIEMKKSLLLFEANTSHTSKSLNNFEEGEKTCGSVKSTTMTKRGKTFTKKNKTLSFMKQTLASKNKMIQKSENQSSMPKKH